MANNQSALCDSARAILESLRTTTGGQYITQAEGHTLTALCASYNNLCEAQTLASQRADNAQTLLAQAQTTIAQLRLNLSEAEQMFESEHAQRQADHDKAITLEERVKFLQGELSRTQAAYHALLSGNA